MKRLRFLSIAIIMLLTFVAFAACDTGEVQKTQIAIPVLTQDSFVYNGSSHTVTVEQNEAYTLGGDVTKNEVGDYNAVVALNDTNKYEWTDGTTRIISLPWSITAPATELNFNMVYQLAVESGFSGTLEELIEAFKGDSAYEIAVKGGFNGTEAQWLATLVGAGGTNGTNGITPHIENGYWYIGTTNTSVKAQGEDGKSAYEIAKASGYDGTETEWLASLAGSNGTTPHIDEDTGYWFIGKTNMGVKAKGEDGENGQSAFEIWKAIHGDSNSTEEDFLEWLKAEPAKDGKSAYELFVQYNPDYLGNEEQWTNDLVNGRLVRFTVTFKVAGSPDIVKSVLYGYDLTDIPEVPEKAGNTGEWSVKSFENITQNIEVTAIYKTIGLAFELINGSSEARLISSNLTSDTKVLSIPNEYEGKPVTTIGYRAFANNTNLTNVTIPDSVTTIELEAFLGCNSIEEITLPFVGANINGSGASFFSYIFGGSTYYDNGTMVPESLESVIITKATFLKIFAFNRSSYIKSIVLPESLTKIGGYFEGDAGGGCQVFEYCESLESINIPSGVTVLGANLFYACYNLKTITLPSTLEHISGGAFEYCRSLTSIEIPNSVKIIGGYAFARCDNLETINIPSSLTTFDDSVFFNSPKIQYEIYNGLRYIDDICFGTVNPTVSKVTLKPTTKFITAGAFENCSNLTSIVIPASVLSFGEGVFYGSQNFATIYYLGENITAWNNITKGGYNSELTSASLYFYSETPVYGGEHWHYVDDVPTVWVE